MFGVGLNLSMEPVVPTQLNNHFDDVNALMIRETRYPRAEIELEAALKKLSHDHLKALHAVLVIGNVFNGNCLAHERQQIIDYLQSVAQSDWPSLMSKVNFITPRGSNGHDIAWATDILTRCSNHTYRTQLVNTANCFYNVDTSTTDRCSYLEILAFFSLKELQTMEEASKKERNQFLKNRIPDVLSGGLNPILNTWLRQLMSKL